MKRMKTSVFYSVCFRIFRNVFASVYAIDLIWNEPKNINDGRNGLGRKKVNVCRDLMYIILKLIFSETFTKNVRTVCVFWVKSVLLGFEIFLSILFCFEKF